MSLLKIASAKWRDCAKVIAHKLKTTGLKSLTDKEKHFLKTIDTSSVVNGVTTKDDLMPIHNFAQYKHKHLKIKDYLENKFGVKNIGNKNRYTLKDGLDVYKKGLDD